MSQNDRYLDTYELSELHNTAIQLGLHNSRDSLLSGIATTFISSIPQSTTPAEQIRIDLNYLNHAEVMTGEEPLKSWLSAAYDLTKAYKEAKLFKSWKEDLFLGSNHSDTPLPPSTTPYKGLQAFGIDDAEMFFGRDTLVRRLLRRLRPTTLSTTKHTETHVDDNLAQHASGNESSHTATTFLALVGASGSGKSSLARAGLLAALRDDSHAPTIQLNSTTWPIRICSHPGTSPFQSLARAIYPNPVNLRPEEPALSWDASSSKALAAMWKNDKTALYHSAQQALQSSPPGTRLVVLLDQFEEVFTLCKDEQERSLFLDALCYAIQPLRPSAHGHPYPLLILITMRADYFGEALQHRDFGAILNQYQYPVRAMHRKELRQAIQRPLERVQCTIEPTLVEQLIADVEKEENSLPLLQLTLEALWKKRNKKTNSIESKHYDEDVGVVGALQRKADAWFTSLPLEQQDKAKQVLLRLVRVREDGRATSQPVEQDFFSGSQDDDTRHLLDSMVQQRLLASTSETIEQDGESAGLQIVNWYSLSHEALLRKWPTLRDLVQSSLEIKLVHQRLTQATQEWLDQNKHTDYLETDKRLEAFEAWNNEYPGTANSQEKEFLKQSLKKREGMIHEEKENRKQAKENKEKAETYKQWARTIALFALAILTLAYYITTQFSGVAERAVSKQKKAEEGKRKAESQTRKAVQKQKQATKKAKKERQKALQSQGRFLTATRDKMREGVRRFGQRELEQIFRRFRDLLSNKSTPIQHQRTIAEFYYSLSQQMQAQTTWVSSSKEFLSQLPVLLNKLQHETFSLSPPRQANEITILKSMLARTLANVAGQVPTRSKYYSGLNKSSIATKIQTMLATTPESSKAVPKPLHKFLYFALLQLGVKIGQKKSIKQLRMLLDSRQNIQGSRLKKLVVFELGLMKDRGLMELHQALHYAEPTSVRECITTTLGSYAARKLNWKNRKATWLSLLKAYHNPKNSGKVRKKIVAALQKYLGQGVLDKLIFHYNHSTDPNLTLYNTKSVLLSMNPKVTQQLCYRLEQYVHKNPKPSSVSSFHNNIVEALGGFGRRNKTLTRPVACLHRALSVQNSKFQCHVAKALGAYGVRAHRSVTTLTNLLLSKPKYRRCFVTSLGQLGSKAKAATPTLLRILSRDLYPKQGSKRKKSTYTTQAIQALGKIGQPHKQIIPFFLQVLTKETAYSLLEPTSNALAEMGVPAVQAVQRLLKQELKQPQTSLSRLKWLVITLGELKQVARPAIPDLLPLLAHKQRRRIGMTTATALSQIGRSAIPGLTKVLTSPNTNARYCALYALGEIGDPPPKTLNTIANVLRSEQDSDVRLSAINALRKSRYKFDIKQLIRSLQVRSGERGFAAFALASSQKKDARQAIPALLRCLQDDLQGASRFRGSCAFALGAIGLEATQVVPALQKSLKDTRHSPSTQWRVAEALGKFGAKAKRAVRSLLSSLHSSDSLVQSASATALGQIGAYPEQVTLELLKKLKANKVSPGTKVSMVKALGVLRTKKVIAIPFLCKLFSKSSRSSDILGAAAIALGRLGAHAPQKWQLKIRNLLKKELAQPKSFIQKEAALGLGHLGKPNNGVYNSLLQCLNSPETKHNKWKETACSCETALAQFGQAPLTKMVEALKKGSPLRRKALSKLFLRFRVHRNVAFQRLMPLLGEPDDNVRDAAALAISFLLHGNISASLAAQLKEPLLRNALKENLFFPGNVRMLSTVLNADKQDRKVRIEAAFALARSCSPQAVRPLLYQLLNTKKQANLQLPAIQALKWLKPMLLSKNEQWKSARTTLQLALSHNIPEQIKRQVRILLLPGQFLCYDNNKRAVPCSKKSLKDAQQQHIQDCKRIVTYRMPRSFCGASSTWNKSKQEPSKDEQQQTKNHKIYACKVLQTLLRQGKLDPKKWKKRLNQSCEDS